MKEMCQTGGSSNSRRCPAEPEEQLSGTVIPGAIYLYLPPANRSLSPRTFENYAIGFLETLQALHLS